MEPLFETNLNGIQPIARGKVRDIYDAGDFLIIVATDRLSAFDYVLPTPIPDKGRVLTQLTIFWLDLLREVVPNHFVSADVDDYPAGFRLFRDQLEGRSMLVRRARMLEVECVARGYVSGSGWKDYRREGSICGIPLPAGLSESDRLPEPVFTPATKAQSGQHDENISFDTAAAQLGVELAGRVRALTLEVYSRAAKYAETRGIIIADTKFEFGFIGDQLVLADEVLTPDSSRFWPRANYQPGGPQASYDKQYVRDYLESIHWNKQPPAPALPADVVQRTSEKYREAYTVLTGKPL
ncbi:MAG TPA: phosphoribosylaminoimidazolesuccinocarboxamide synthase [Bryobacteraceae bacterium]|nr:phosphoribosylaminoimidazolesuccinocarboxamide synthase [Bryobacteraceae bacterium]